MAQVKYKGKVIADISKGQKLTLRVDGHELEGDIVIDGFNGGGSTECDGCIIEVDTLPTENIDENAVYKCGDSYYNRIVGLRDVIMVADSDARLVTDEIPNAQFYQVATKPTENIVESNLEDVWAFYYVEDENDIFFYANIGNGAEWVSLSLTFGSSFQGVIADISEATANGYYAVGGAGWKKYLAPNGIVTITENSTVDVTECKTAIVSIPQPRGAYIVSTADELPIDVAVGSLAIVLNGGE